VLHSLLTEGDAGAGADAEERWALTVGERTLDLRTRPADGYVDATMDQGVAEIGGVVEGDLLAEYVAALGLALDDLHEGLPVQVVSTGLPYLIVPLRRGLDRARISHPDFEGLLAVSGAKFVYVLDPDRPEGRTWDNAGRVEDVATGSAAGPTAGYLIEHGAHPPDAPMVIHQGRFVGRPSTIEVNPGADGRLWVGGPVAPVASGRFRAQVG
jgi:PhzF family phenazine biosynthesis protein